MMIFYVFLLALIVIGVLLRMVSLIDDPQRQTPHYRPLEEPPICLVVICNNRPELLKNTLQSILDANGFSDTRLYISQSGDDSSVSRILQEYPQENILRHIDHTPKVANRLARHFGWTFNTVFQETDCDGFVVIEDDLELSPDFLNYFKTAIPFLKSDPTLITASLWNDLGFTHNTHDKTAVKRTDFFPGLGWYLSRGVWENILGPSWPDHDWDWYVRDTALKLGMDSLIPEVPRDFHVAKTGTYMTRSFFDKYFKNININRDDTFKWSSEYFTQVSPLSKYKLKVEADIIGATHVMDNFNDVLNDNQGIVVAWVKDFGKMRNKGQVRAKCRPFLRETGIWEGEPERGRWNGINHVWSQAFKAYLYVIDMSVSKSEFVHHLKPPNVRIFRELEVCDAFIF